MLLLQGSQDTKQQGSSDRDVRLVLAVNKADLLPSQATPRRLEVSQQQQAADGMTLPHQFSAYG